jgi:alkylation response protein AidB-like acyl-CoA dehydrogenase
VQAFHTLQAESIGFNRFITLQLNERLGQFIAAREIDRITDPNLRVARIAMAKVEATRCMQFCADSAVQILGGMGFMRGTVSERVYREVKVMMIGVPQLRADQEGNTGIVHGTHA